MQADILKEDQAQNTCIFSTEFALRMMGDVQQYFIDERVRNFYSVSISGYHIAEAGANPISQLAFTLANGFTIAEYYLARGMKIDDFAPNLSFFFSNGMDPEYVVIGRVARRIWARAMRERYQAGPRSQMLKYHVQTSGRSLHAREISFNDIRTTLQAMYALFDNCNSLHTNAYDEALTTPTEASVRRAVAIQLIINRELGLNKIQNPWQGSFAIDYLTDMVEEAVYREFEALSERGGVLGAMETMYQRGKIQEESLYYETKKHDGSLPIVGVNTFLSSADGRGGAQGDAPDPLHRGGEAGSGRGGARLPAAQRGGRARGTGAPAARRRRRRQRVRRADGERQGLLARADLAGAVSGGRAVSSEYVRSGSPSAVRIAVRARSRSCTAAAAWSPSVGSRRQRRQDLQFDGTGARQPAAGWQRPAGSGHCRGHQRAAGPHRGGEGAGVELQQPRRAREGPLRKEHQRVSLIGIAQHAPRIRRAAVPIEAFHELRPQALERRAGQRHGRHLALDDEAEAWRQRRGQHEAVEVAGVIADHDALPRGQMLARRVP